MYITFGMGNKYRIKGTFCRQPMNVGLEQPIANWSRRAVSLPGVVGKRVSRLPSRPEAIARYRGPGSY